MQHTQRRNSARRLLNAYRASKPQVGMAGKPLGRGSGVSGWKNNFDEETGKLYWDTLGKWVQAGKVLIPKSRVIEGLDEGLMNEVLNSYIGHKPVAQEVIHP